MRNFVVALSISGLIAAAPIGGTHAAPLTAVSSAVKPATNSVARDDLTEVHWRGGWGIGAGLLAGALIGSAVAAPYYYEPYARPYYGYPYGYGAYYPAYAYRPYWGGYRWGPRPWRYGYAWSAPRPWGYAVRRAPPWRYGHGWRPRHHHWHHRGIIRARHRW